MTRIENIEIELKALREQIRLLTIASDETTRILSHVCRELNALDCHVRGIQAPPMAAGNSRPAGGQ